MYSMYIERVHHVVVEIPFLKFTTVQILHDLAYADFVLISTCPWPSQVNINVIIDRQTGRVEKVQ